MSGLERAGARLLPGWMPAADRLAALRGVESALLRYRVLAWTVGVGLLVLVVVGVPLQVGAGAPEVVKVVGPIHGFLYIVYLFVALDMARRARFSLPQLVMMLCAGLLPVLAFVIERKVTARVSAELADARAAAAGEGPGQSAALGGEAMPPPGVTGR